MHFISNTVCSLIKTQCYELIKYKDFLVKKCVYNLLFSEESMAVILIAKPRVLQIIN